VVAVGTVGRRACWLILLVLAACASRQPQRPGGAAAVPLYHCVSAGETLYGIGRKYGVPYSEIARINHLSDPGRIQVGQRLMIPRGGRSEQPSATTAKSWWRWWGKGREALERDLGAPEFHWPINDGTVTSGFGVRNGSVHDGIDIAAPVGAFVRAAADGEVAYCGLLPGYGNVVILRHAGGYATVYGHNDSNHAKEGETVHRGQFIATVGLTGRTTGPNLHFEIRKDNVARDPFSYLPGHAPPAAGEKVARGIPETSGRNSESSTHNPE
jgi:murein DD-endopeptidase MepM/ murein hydrolase activator NlpD